MLFRCRRQHSIMSVSNIDQYGKLCIRWRWHVGRTLRGAVCRKRPRYASLVWKSARKIRWYMMLMMMMMMMISPRVALCIC